MINLHIMIRGHCHEFFPEIPEEFEHQAEEGISLRQIMTGLAINPMLIMGVIVNGKLAKKDHLPKDGDRIILLSPPSGG